MSGWPPSGYFIPPYRRYALPEDERSLCEVRGEHQGEEDQAPDEDGTLVLRWTCCDATEVIGRAAPEGENDE